MRGIVVLFLSFLHRRDANEWAIRVSIKFQNSLLQPSGCFFYAGRVYLQLTQSESTVFICTG